VWGNGQVSPFALRGGGCASSRSSGLGWAESGPGGRDEGRRLSRRSRVINRASGKVDIGHAPPYSVLAPGALPRKPLPDRSPGPSLDCAAIVNTVDARTRAKTGVNELLRK